MKLRLFLAACVFLRVGSAWSAELPDTQSFSSIQAPRVSPTTGLIDFWQVGQNAAHPNARLLSLFGYNSGSAGFIEIFNTASTNPVIRITGFDENSSLFTSNIPNIIASGDAIQLTNTLGGITAGIYWAFPIGSNTFFLNGTRALAIAGSADKAPSGSSAAANVNLVPVHSFKMAATDNYSCIVPSTGINFGRGILIATSTTAGTFTYGGTNITAWVTLGQP